MLYYDEYGSKENPTIMLRMGRVRLIHFVGSTAFLINTILLYLT